MNVAARAHLCVYHGPFLKSLCGDARDADGGAGVVPKETLIWHETMTLISLGLTGGLSNF